MKGQLEIHSENILPIIKKWLYSEKDIFVRELVSNACDAIHKVKILRDKGDIQADDKDFRVDVKIDKEKKTLTFSDNGIGMDAEEVQKYIAQIAFSGAEDFVAKYKSGNEKDQFIGHFGLGFYSAYMVADKVEINTLSYKAGSEPVEWICEGSHDYILEKGTRTERGTDIILYLNKESDEYLETSKMKSILNHYCQFLPYPVYLEGELINKEEPLWIKSPSECTEKDYLDFYRYLEPFGEEPLFWVHLNVDYPFHLKGILYFPRLKRDFDFNKSTIKLFCNRVFVSDNCKDIIPEYLTALRGVIDSPDIPLNVSRSYLQMDKTVRMLSTHISKKVADSLSTLYKTDRKKYENVWEEISMFVKLGAVQDEKFYEKVKDILIFKTTENEWTTLPDVIAKDKEKIYYTVHEKHHEHLHTVFKEKNIDILVLGQPIDPYLISTIEKNSSPVQFKRIDSAVDEHLIDKEREKSVLDAEGRTEASKMAEFIKKQLGDIGLEVEAKSLKTDNVSAVLVMDENQRRMRDYMSQMDPKMSKMMGGSLKKTMVVNTNNALISSIYKLEDKDPELAKQLVHEVYELALLNQREMDESLLTEFIGRTNKVLEKLALMAVK
jgi:molecular chaperone HtpG